jgi:hypothetical protein
LSLSLFLLKKIITKNIKVNAKGKDKVPFESGSKELPTYSLQTFSNPESLNLPLSWGQSLTDMQVHTQLSKH